MKRWIVYTLTMFLFAASPVFALDQQELKKELARLSLEYADKRGAAEIRKGLALAQKDLLDALKSSPGMKNNPYVKHLESVVNNAPQLDTWAKKIASGDPKQILQVHQEMSEKMGANLINEIKNPQVQSALKTALESKQKVAEGAGALGYAMEGDYKPAARFVGTSILNVTPIAPVVTFYQNAYGAMAYAKDKFVNNEVEGLYQEYSKGNIDEQTLRDRMTRGGYAWLIRDRMNDLRKSKAAEMKGSGYKPGDPLYDHITRVSDQMVEDELVSTFNQRIAKEKQDRHIAEVRKQAAQDYRIITDILMSEAEKQGPEKAQKALDWLNGGFAERVRRHMETDPAIRDMNVSEEQKLKAATRLYAFKMLHQKDRLAYEKYRQELLDSHSLEATKSAKLAADAAAKQLKERKDSIKDRLAKRLSKLSMANLTAFMDYVGAKDRDSLYSCLCGPRGAGSSSFYSPKDGYPCKRVGALSESWHGFSSDPLVWKSCMGSTMVGRTTNDKGQLVSQGVSFDDHIANRIIEMTRR